MADKTDNINKQRNFWLEKIDTQIAEMEFLSLDNEKADWQDKWHDLETSFICLWRFDRKLELKRAEIARAARQESDEEVS